MVQKIGHLNSLEPETEGAHKLCMSDDCECLCLACVDRRYGVACPHCEYRTNNSTGMRNHLETIHSEKPMVAEAGTFKEMRENDEKWSRSLSEIMGQYRAMDRLTLHQCLSTGTLHMLAIVRVMEEKYHTEEGR